MSNKQIKAKCARAITAAEDMLDSLPDGSYRSVGFYHVARLREFATRVIMQIEQHGSIEPDLSAELDSALRAAQSAGAIQ